MHHFRLVLKIFKLIHNIVFRESKNLDISVLIEHLKILETIFTLTAFKNVLMKSQI